MRKDNRCPLKRRAGKRPGASVALAAAAGVLLLCAGARGAEIEKLSGRKLKGKILKETEKFISIEVRIGRSGGSAVMSVRTKDIHAITDKDGKRRVLNARPASAKRPRRSRTPRKTPRGTTAKKSDPPPVRNVGWRMDGTGRYPDASPPMRFSSSQNVVWAVKMPSWGNASPVVVGSLIFVCAEPDILLCVDARNGRILWKRGGHASVAQGRAKAHKDNGYTSATPASDGKQVYAVFGQGVVAAYDLKGARKWVKFIEAPRHGWGASTGPVATGDKVIVQFNGALRALRAADGGEVWNVSAQTRWGTPVPLKIGGAAAILHPSGAAYAVADGKRIANGMGNLEYACPVVHKGVSYFIDEKGGKAFRLPAGNGQRPQQLWSNRPARDRYYGSALYYEGILYAINRSGTFSAWDAATGKELYQKKLNLGGGQNAVYPSPTLAGKYIFLGGLNGTILVIQPGRTYREVARNKLEPLRSSPVFVGKRMYVRGLSRLWCIGR